MKLLLLSTLAVGILMGQTNYELGGTILVSESRGTVVVFDEDAYTVGNLFWNELVEPHYITFLDQPSCAPEISTMVDTGVPAAPSPGREPDTNIMQKTLTCSGLDVNNVPYTLTVNLQMYRYKMTVGSGRGGGGLRWAVIGGNASYVQ